MASEKFFNLQLPNSDALSIKTVLESVMRDVGDGMVLFGPTDNAGQFSFVVHRLDGDEIDTKVIMDRVNGQALIYWPALKGNKTRSEESDKHASVCTPASGGQDVEEGDLSTRGWILQERALSRRSIHFTEAQIYFECGSCIWCETGQPIDYRAPLSSSYFPLSERSNRPAECSRIFKDLFRRYSKMDLTNAKDRPLAIAGLEYRLSQVYNTDVIYGMLRSHFAESLFWQRSGSSWLQAQIKIADWPFHVGSPPPPNMVVDCLQRRNHLHRLSPSEHHLE
ncbi:hypothetical protein CEP54_013562 [Fusarium duplospermum]|uniref:Uncharacterized protein n=1 Tax=Fusarium duplospermum TaxID=1325734 RepID=A0A428P247_9HYPO|nr:hypothetical protein CEP54_013562 [Fusarium duplospermum]